MFSTSVPVFLHILKGQTQTQRSSSHPAKASCCEEQRSLSGEGEDIEMFKESDSNPLTARRHAISLISETFQLHHDP